MRSAPILHAALVLSALLAFARAGCGQGGSAPNPRAAQALYRQRLAARCPDKHLEMLSPGALSDIDDEFLGKLSARQRRGVQSSMTRRCRGIDMGATCGNVGFLEAAIHLHKLDAYVAHVCAVPQRCTDYSMCTETR